MLYRDKLVAALLAAQRMCLDNVKAWKDILSAKPGLIWSVHACVEGAQETREIPYTNTGKIRTSISDVAELRKQLPVFGASAQEPNVKLEEEKRNWWR